MHDDKTDKPLTQEAYDGSKHYLYTPEESAVITAFQETSDLKTTFDTLILI